MSEVIKTGWLHNDDGDKFAPRTLSSQIVTSDGISIENKISDGLAKTETKMKSAIDDKMDGKSAVQIITWEVGD